MISIVNLFLIYAAFEGVEAVFHMAAPNSSINNYQLHYSVSVQGKTCKHRSSIVVLPIVVFDLT